VIFTLKKILTALILPPSGLILLALTGLWLARRHRRTGAVITVGALLALVALSLPFTAHWLLQTLETASPITPRQLRQAEAIVILGGGVYRGPEYGGDTVDHPALGRLRYGAHLQRTSRLPILVTGGAPWGGTAEAEAMRAVIVDEFHGQVRWVEPASADTAQNARFSAALLRRDGIRRIALVSHAWHLPRATRHFESEGLEVIPAPTKFSTLPPALLVRFLPSAHALEDSSLALHEWLGLLVLRLQTAAGLSRAE